MQALAPGARVVIRDAEWLVRRVDQSSDGGQQLTCEGLSELVQDRQSIFLTSLERDIQVLDPAETQLVNDRSARYADALLYLESHLQRAVPNDDRIHAADKAAMQPVDYQFTPALQSLAQPRHRILIADAVGLGKTLEAGILATELIRRGKGRRILVVSQKSMLTQFQKEFWNRFTIPLTRLDSTGLARVRNRIPANHNPFYYYDKSIISVDTLKQDSEYRVYLEQAWWDIIIIDEAHNVADKGNSSQRARLAELLATRSDSLIMLSATPHNGRARSFASLLNILDPTAIVDPDDYSTADFDTKGLVIRRFKKDIRDQVTDVFRERQIHTHRHAASAEEEAAYRALLAVPFTHGGEHAKGKRGALLRVGLQKTLFSSPAAARVSANNRIETLRKRTANEDIDNEIDALQAFDAALKGIEPERYAKYQSLLALLQSKPFDWSPKDTDDRLVIFSERIETLAFLETRLPRDLRLDKNQIDRLTGDMSDIEQQQKVETFGQPGADVRVLLCSDVAAEGINLHYLSHRIIHFDLPWSLMVFQQRNGRIDRFGQTHTPQIHYLVTESQNETVRGDLRILEILREKDDQAYRNIGDPSAFMGVHDAEKETGLTERAMASGMGADSFSDRYTPERKSTRAEAFLQAVEAAGKKSADTAPPSANDQRSSPPSVFGASSYRFARAALERLADQRNVQWQSDADKKQIALVAPKDLQQRFNLLPPEIKPTDWQFVLAENIDAINAEVQRCRQDESAWPKTHYLWPQHPVVEWLADRSLTTFGRQSAPVVWLRDRLEADEAVFIVNGQLPNKRGHPLIYEWLAVCFRAGRFQGIEPLADTISRTGLSDGNIPNRGDEPDIRHLQALVGETIKRAEEHMRERRTRFEKDLGERCRAHLANLQRLHAKQTRQLALAFERSAKPEQVKLAERNRNATRVDRIFEEHETWIEETLTAEHHPHLKIVTVLADSTLQTKAL